MVVVPVVVAVEPEARAMDGGRRNGIPEHRAHVDTGMMIRMVEVGGRMHRSGRRRHRLVQRRLGSYRCAGVMELARCEMMSIAGSVARGYAWCFRLVTGSGLRRRCTRRTMGAGAHVGPFTVVGRRGSES